MTKDDLIDALAAKGYYKNEAKIVVNELFKIITEALLRGENVNIRGFGEWRTRIYKGHMIADVNMGERREIGDKRVISFHVAPGLKQKVN